MLTLALLLLSPVLVAAQVTPGPQLTNTYAWGTAPDKLTPLQYGTDACVLGGHNQTSLCQVAVMNSVEDFCVWGPPFSTAEDGFGAIAYTERFEVAYCTKSGYGTRLIPDGTLTGVHWVQTPDYVQVTGDGDFTKIGIAAGDSGGELDPHGDDETGNPQGGLVYSTAFTGQPVQVHEWTNFMSATQFCFRACKDGPQAAALCQHIYDIMGCAWNMPANYATGVVETCQGDDAIPMGIYGTSTFHQGDPVTPDAHPAPASSNCVTTTLVPNGLAVSSSVIPSSSAVVTTSTLPGGQVTSVTSVAAAGAQASASGSSSGSTSGASRYTAPALGLAGLVVSLSFLLL